MVWTCARCEHVLLGVNIMMWLNTVDGRVRRGPLKNSLLGLRGQSKPELDLSGES